MEATIILKGSGKTLQEITQAVAQAKRSGWLVHYTIEDDA